jgi:hypothetical protein
MPVILAIQQVQVGEPWSQGQLGKTVRDYLKNKSTGNGVWFSL